MTNILTVLPDFDTSAYAHILPSLERALISTADLLTLDALDVARRAQLPPGEVKKLSAALLDALHAGVDGLDAGSAEGRYDGSGESSGSGLGAAGQCVITTLDDGLDARLGGGIPAGCLTEIVGESAAGKTQFLLTLLLSVQLPRSPGPSKSALYISTEAPLQTTRLSQILQTHPKLSALPPTQRPSLSRVHSTHIHDVEAQDHILHYQVPVAIAKHNVGLLVIDSVAANFRAEFDKGQAHPPRRGGETFAKRSAQLLRLGKLLRDIAWKYNVAVVVANQVADRFMTVEAVAPGMNVSQSTQLSRPDSPAHALKAPIPTNVGNMTSINDASAPALSTDDPLSLDHQLRFFSGWGDDPTASTNLKTPSLGLVWANQLTARIALLKEPVYEERAYHRDEERAVSGWKRTVKVVFSAWCAEGSAAFEIWEGGVRAVRQGDG